MKNPIPHSSLFVTPESMQDLDSYIQDLSKPEQAIAYRFTMYALNLAYKMVEDAKNAPAKEFM
jgi:hypothetical protein